MPKPTSPEEIIALLRDQVAELKAELAARPIVTVKSERDVRTCWPDGRWQTIVVNPQTLHTVTVAMPNVVFEFKGMKMEMHKPRSCPDR